MRGRQHGVAPRCELGRLVSSSSSCRRSAWLCPCVCAHWYGCAGRGPAGAAMAQAAIAAQIHQPLDVHGHFAAQVALDHEVAVDRLADLQHLSVGQLVHAPLVGDADLGADVLRELGTDAMDILQRDHHALLRRYVNACDASHDLSPSPGALALAAMPARRCGPATKSKCARRLAPAALAPDPIACLS